MVLVSNGDIDGIPQYIITGIVHLYPVLAGADTVSTESTLHPAICTARISGWHAAQDCCRT